LKPHFDEDIREQIRRLDCFRDPRPFGRRFINAYSRLFIIYKNIVFFSLAESGRPLFNKGLAFDTFYALHPRLVPLRKRLDKLFFYYLAMTKKANKQTMLRRGSARELDSYIRALDRLGREVLP